MADKIRVVIADDSALMRRKIAEILIGDPAIEVVAICRDGKEAIEAVHNLRPDVVTLDVEMPILGGLEALGYIMSEVPTPCVMISAFTREGAKESIQALEFGAVDFVAKPGGVISLDIDRIAKEIIEKIKVASKVSVNKLRVIWAERAEERERILKKPAAMKRVFAVASSTGGTQALATVLPSLPADFPACVLCVQHMPEGFTKSLAERLNWQSKIRVVEAEDRMPLKPAQAILARGGMHMEVAGSDEKAHIVLADKPPELGVKPNANIMMQSAARIFKERTVGVVLTGMGSDGTLGAQAIKSGGGVVIAEDQLSCVVYGMPKSVIDAGLADKVVPLAQVAREMERLA
jgi:two-component system chemotaxis response regulator CheB